MNRILLTVITFLCVILTEKIFCYKMEIDHLLPLEKYIGAFIAFFLITYVKNRKIRLILLLLIPILSYFQMVHLSYYGVPVYPSAIYLMFFQVEEIFGTVKEDYQIFILPMTLTLISVATIVLAHKKLKLERSIKWLHWVLIFYLFYNPARTFVTGNTWGRQPSTQEMMGMNIYLSVSYFLGRILPDKLLGNKNKNYEKFPMSFEQVESFDGNIIFVIGESLSANHISALDYKRDTTPFLRKLKIEQDPSFHISYGISSGVSTDIAVAFVVNNTFGLQGQEDILGGKKCLFKFAKDAGFKTSFYSSQSQQQLRYITNSLCLKYVDQYKNLKNLDPNYIDENAADDKLLLQHFEEDFADKNKRFYVLHQRGSHSPYNLRYPETQRPFALSGDYRKDRVNHYDNTVYEFDRFMESLITKVQKLDMPTIILYISDHGEGLGENGVWGHAVLKKPSFSIPFIAYYHQVENNFTFTNEPTHLEVTLFLSKLLGQKSDVEFPLKKYTILGNDMDGFSGSVDVKFDKDGNVSN